MYVLLEHNDLTPSVHYLSLTLQSGQTYGIY